MKKIAMIILFILFLSSSAFPADIYESLEAGHHEGDTATEFQNIKASDKTTSELIGTSDNVILKDPSGNEQLPDQQTVSIGAEAGVKKNVKTYNIPLSYGFPLNISGASQEFLNFSLKIPYTSREIGNNDDSGLGDIKLSADYLTRFDKILLNTVFLVKFATGDYDDADVPLGTGSTDYGLSFNAKMYFDRFSLKAGLGYVLTGDYSDGSDEIKYGDEYIVSAGGEYKIKDSLFAGGEFIYNAHQEDEYNVFGNKSKAAGLNTLDFIPSLTFFVTKYNIGLTTKVVIPVSDSWNGGNGPDPDDPDRDVEFKFQLAAPF
ncbi:MAG: hypothetical protein RBR08_15820 [Desulforegulaceae bacterium]|nr:hypothetical protein [Desulforegulaceae bacterium]